MAGRNTESFMLGTGVQPATFQCADCGHESSNRKHFKKGTEEQLTCSSGHYTASDGTPKRARNPYARR